MTTTTATRSTSASTLHALLDLARGEDLDAGNSGPARRVQLCIVGALASLGLAAVFGIAVGSTVRLRDGGSERGEVLSLTGTRAVVLFGGRLRTTVDLGKLTWVK